MILDRCVKNSIKASKDQFLDGSFQKITSKHAKDRTDLQKAFDAEEADLLRKMLSPRAAAVQSGYRTFHFSFGPSEIFSLE